MSKTETTSNSETDAQLPQTTEEAVEEYVAWIEANYTVVETTGNGGSTFVYVDEHHMTTDAVEMAGRFPIRVRFSLNSVHGDFGTLVGQFQIMEA